MKSNAATSGLRFQDLLLSEHLVEVQLRPVAAEQLARPVEVLHRLLLLTTPIGDLGEALEVAALLDRAALRRDLSLE